jgi:Cytochrome P450
MTYPERANITWAMLDVLRGGRLRIQLSKAMYLLRWTWWLKAIGVVHDFVNLHIRRAYQEIEEREERLKAGLEVGSERTDLIWYMATNLRDEELLRSQLCLIFVPNNDTTSIFISNVLWHLARNPDAWEKCRAEVLAHGDAPLTFEALRGMKYVNAVLNESKSPPLASLVCLSSLLTISSASSEPQQCHTGAPVFARHCVAGWWRTGR